MKTFYKIYSWMSFTGVVLMAIKLGHNIAERESTGVSIASFLLVGTFFVMINADKEAQRQ